MRVGVSVELQEGMTASLLRTVVAGAEELGIESLWFSDHLMSLEEGDAARPSVETYVALAYVASATERLAFGSLVSPVTFRHPVALLRSAASLQALSDGRFTLGLGAGWAVREHATFGIEFPPVSRRLAALEETLQLVRRYEAGVPCTFRGDFVHVVDAHFAPRGPIRLLVGGGGERRLLKIAAELADEWNVPAIGPELYRHKAAVLDRHCAEAGRDPATLTRSVAFTQALGATPSAARSAFDRLLRRTPERYRPSRRADSPVWVTGTADEAASQLRGYEELGVERAILQWRRPPTRADLEVVAQVAEAVV